jgi:glucose-6-phosphate isomerase
MKFTNHSSQAVQSVAAAALQSRLTPYLTKLRRIVEVGGYTAPECSLLAPSDEYMLRAVEAIIERVYSRDLRYIFVIGIGGSNLGTKAIYDAMAVMRDLFVHDAPRLIFIDTVDPSLIAVARKIITGARSAEQVLFLVITKSGTTTETIYNAESLLATFAETLC